MAIQGVILFLNISWNVSSPGAKKVEIDYEAKLETFVLKSD